MRARDQCQPRCAPGGARGEANPLGTIALTLSNVCSSIAQSRAPETFPKLWSGRRILRVFLLFIWNTPAWGLAYSVMHPISAARFFSTFFDPKGGLSAKLDGSVFASRIARNPGRYTSKGDLDGARSAIARSEIEELI